MVFNTILTRVVYFDNIVLARTVLSIFPANDVGCGDSLIVYTKPPLPYGDCA